MAKKEITFVEMGDGFADITLSRPLDVDGAPVSVLRMREPTVADQIAMEKSKGTDAEREISMIANLCEVSPADINKLTMRDYKRVQGAFLGFSD
jgi:hypothetical protein